MCVVVKTNAIGVHRTLVRRAAGRGICFAYGSRRGRRRWRVYMNGLRMILMREQRLCQATCFDHRGMFTVGCGETECLSMVHYSKRPKVNRPQLEKETEYSDESSVDAFAFFLLNKKTNRRERRGGRQANKSIRSDVKKRREGRRRRRRRRKKAASEATKGFTWYNCSLERTMTVVYTCHGARWESEREGGENE